MLPAVVHAIQRRYLAENLVRLRRSDEQQRYAVSQRRGRIDPNPHQIDAVVFALRRLPEGGCILADEVGLGKTIEAGLVIAQKLAEGASRVLIVVPKALIGQWQTEMLELFGIPTRDAKEEVSCIGETGVFLAGREFAGSEAGASALSATVPFDLCVIDEAHEIFAGVYKRFDKHGIYQDDAKDAQMAHRVRAFLRGGTPVLLLTATPIQNSLAELWGLVQYVEPTETLLGNLATFRKVFCDGDDRQLVPEQAEELRSRLAQVLMRTLRREAQEFLERPFVGRTTRLFEYPMTREERALYDDVTSYLLEPSLCAFRGAPRRLLLIGFHRRMASSLPALAASLRNVAARLERALRDQTDPRIDGLSDLPDLSDLEVDLDDFAENEPEAADDGAPTPERIERELRRVRSFIVRAEALPSDGKAEALLQAVETVDKRARAGECSGKMVVFTESLTTQEYLRTLLMGHGIADEEVTLFRGTNDTARAREALDRWMQEVGQKLSVASRPSKQVAVRLALVHEFRTRSRVFISTEAGAKGLNLQFCDTLINYDLPWNPQRIEQRIGRCHRYGQKRDVTVVSFLAKDNEAQRLTFEILSKKLDLFGTVLDASDEVLHQPDTDAPEAVAMALGADFETSLRRIYERARTREEIEQELRSLRDEIGVRRSRFEHEQKRMLGLIQAELHEAVQERIRRLRSIRDTLPAGLAQLDRDMERLVTGYLAGQGIPYAIEHRGAHRVLHVEASPSLLEGMREGGDVLLGGAGRDDALEPLHVAHALVQAAIDEARESTSGRIRVRVGHDGTEGLAKGSVGRLVVEKVRYAGFEVVENLVAVGVFEGAVLLGDQALALLEGGVGPGERTSQVEESDVEDALEEALFDDQERVAQREQPRLEQALVQLERFMEDQALVLRRRRREVGEALLRAEDARMAAMGAEARGKAQRQIEKLEGEVADLDRELERLGARDDATYVRFSKLANDRRYAEPQRQRILDLEIEVE